MFLQHLGIVEAMLTVIAPILVQSMLDWVLCLKVGVHAVLVCPCSATVLADKGGALTLLHCVLGLVCGKLKACGGGEGTLVTHVLVVPCMHCQVLFVAVRAAEPLATVLAGEDSGLFQLPFLEEPVLLSYTEHLVKERIGCNNRDRVHVLNITVWPIFFFL